MDDDEYNAVSANLGRASRVGDIVFDTTTGTLNVFDDKHSWITINDSTDLNDTNSWDVVFEDHMPDPQELKQMCEEYPALEKVYEHFKTVYKMVHQDWRGKQDSENGSLF